jgi:hypothetical protein
MNINSMCATSEHIHPPPDGGHSNILLRKHRAPIPRSVYESAFIDSLFLFKQLPQFSVADMLLLIDAGIWSKDSEDKLLPDLVECKLLRNEAWFKF